MNTDQIQSLIRTALKFAAGLLAAHGLHDQAGILNSPDVAAACMLLISLVWSHWTHGGPASGSRFPIAVALASLLMLGSARAQTTNTNPPADFWSGIGGTLNSLGISTSPTNYALAPFVGISLDGGDKLSAGVLLIENVSDNVGFVVGFDHLWFGGKPGSANIVSGGVTLKAPMHPLRFITSKTNAWAYTVVVTPYALALAGAASGDTQTGGGGLASIIRGGVNFDLVNWSGWKLATAIDYGSRNGAGAYNGNWADLSLNIRKNF